MQQPTQTLTLNLNLTLNLILTNPATNFFLQMQVWPAWFRVGPPWAEVLTDNRKKTDDDLELTQTLP